MKNKQLITLVSAFVLVLIIIPTVLADGMIWDPDFRPIPEDSQQAMINYENGIEKLIISVRLNDKEMRDAIWVFPVPSLPDDTVIDVVPYFERFYGTNVKSEAKRTVEDIMKIIRNTQIYPAFFSYNRYSIMRGSFAALGKGTESISNDGVTVYEHIEKEGMVSELVTANNAGGLLNYLYKRGLNVNGQSISVLNDYIGKDYTFVVSWISPSYQQEEYGEWRQIGLQVSFPTKEMFFPLKPTSGYGSKEIPITLFVVGYVSPNLSDLLESYTKVDYFYQTYYSAPYEYGKFISMNNQELKYTRIIINAPSKYFREDLTFNNEVPIYIKYATAIVNHKTAITIGLLIAIAMISSFAAGFIVFRNFEKKWMLKYLAIGFASCLTIIGTIVATILFKTREVSKTLKAKLKEERIWAISSDPRKIYFILLLTAIFTGMTVLFKLIMMAPLK